MARSPRHAGKSTPKPPRRATNPVGGNVTLKDVAKVAGVSPITVSRVLSRPELVTPATIEHVQAVITRTGYVPNLLAGGLRSRRSKLVAAIVPQISNSIYVETIESLTDQLGEAGYQVLLGLSRSEVRKDELLAAILSRRPDGIFLIGINHSDETRRRLLAARIPIVETWDLTPTPIDMLIGFSHEKVGQAIAEYLLGKGYRRFGLIWADDERAAARRRGFLSVLEKRGIAVVATSIGPTPSTLGLGREELARLLDAGAHLDAVVCSSDFFAQGAVVEAQARGLAVPGDLAVMGYGDFDFAAHTVPALSTIRIDRPTIGLRAAELLLARMNGVAVADKVVDVGFRLIQRASA